MKVTPEIAEAMYNLLRSMRPFSKWNLPDSDQVGFHINGLKGEMGSHLYHTDAHHIRLSQRHVRDFESLSTTVAHEVIHMKQLMDGKKRDHGNYFKQHAFQVCEEMVWHMKNIL